MALRSGRGASISLEMLDLYARHGNLDGKEFADVVARRAAFDSQITEALDESLANPSRMHGWRVQALFEAMVIALGTVRLIKQEDVGTYFFDDASGAVKPPDFRIVTEDGEQLLVEVKGVSPRDQTKSRKLRGRDVEELRRYAEMTGARLVYAHYWSALNLWTLVSVDNLTLDESNYVLSFEAAMLANEMVAVGDAWIATVSPLTLTIVGTPGSGNSMTVDGELQQIELQIAEVKIAAADREVIDPVERRLAMFFVLYGSWEEELLPVEAEDRTLPQVTFSYTPAVPDGVDAEPPPSIIGQLSAMYSQLYNAATLGPDNSVETLHHDPEPGMLQDLLPPDYWHRVDGALPIWKLNVSPASSEVDAGGCDSDGAEERG
ncbi:hypothetical protein IU450_34070 [Nocardia abscessus]|uniref:hypothetical protein n=1 Tax=Nocardia abscessus TaxID=120957 RepID=UPI0018936C0F|nr:hypothetical protein [Nocardia abscessus]MBF6340880.1 hypothetical protein [Nocardia abscessus]